MKIDCKVCEESHEPSRGLSFDGRGINSCGIYRQRIATFEPERESLGDVFAAAPEMLEALKDIYSELEKWSNGEDWATDCQKLALNAIAKAEGK